MVTADWDKLRQISREEGCRVDEAFPPAAAAILRAIRPPGAYRLVLADPPWQHNDRKSHRKDNPAKATRLGMGAAGNYRTMPTSEIAALGQLVQRVTTPDAYLAMWVLESMPGDVKTVLDAWGFEQVSTLFAWIKTCSTGPFFGPGKYSAGNLERCILARRNRRKFPCWHSTAAGEWKPAQVILAPHARYPAGHPKAGKIIHSRKPVEAHERLERWLDPYLAGAGKLELFATQRRAGWVCLGDQVSGPDIARDLGRLRV